MICQIFSELSTPFECIVWTTAQGQLFHAHSPDGLEAGLLPSGITTVSQFFPLNEGDVALIKDPAIGGPGRDRLALVQCLLSENEQRTGLWAATSFRLPDSADFKLPPVPLRQNNECNQMLLEALGPSRDILENVLRKLDETAAHVRQPCFNELWSRRGLTEREQLHRDRFKKRIEELPEGEVLYDLSTGSENIRLRLQSDGRALRFDFTGTSPGKRLFLPLAATSGLVRTMVREWLQWENALSASCAHLIPLTVPNGCFLNAQSRNDCSSSIEEAAAWLKTAVEGALHRWDRRQLRALTNYFDLNAELRFNGLSSAQIRLPCGSPARDGSDGVSFCQQRPGSWDLSLEELERRWPVRVQRISERNSSSGKGRYSGGRGLLLQLEILKPGAVMISASPEKWTVERHQSGMDASGAHLTRQSKEQNVEALKAVPLEKGDVLTLFSGTGGGLLEQPGTSLKQSPT